MSFRDIFSGIQHRSAPWVLLGILALLPGLSRADGIPEVPPVIPGMSGWNTNSFIGGNAMSDITGFAGVNSAAGHENLQSNAAAVGLGGANGKGLPKVHSSQSLRLGSDSLPDSSRARISDGAFSNGSGVFSINQASGLGNAQANGVSIGVGRTVRQMSDMELGQSVTIPAALKDKMQQNGSRNREAVVGERTFSGTRGIVQVNQSAGTGNATANGFSLNVGAGGR